MHPKNADTFNEITELMPASLTSYTAELGLLATLRYAPAYLGGLAAGFNKEAALRYTQFSTY